jgi:hypothetical protein
MKRTDKHAPSTIEPSDYRFVTIHYGGKDLEVSFEGNREAVEALNRDMKETGDKYSDHDHGGSCHICGAWANSLATFHNAKSQSYIQAGLDCAQKMELGDPGQFRAHRKALKLAKDEHKRALQFKAGKLKAHALFKYAGLGRALELCDLHAVPTLEGEPDFMIRKREHDIFTVCDIVRTVERLGKLSPKQAKFLGNLLERIDSAPSRVAKFLEDQASNISAPEGRQTITGIIRSVKHLEEDQWGNSPTKLLVECEGFKVWCSRPSKIWWSDKGDEISMAITLERSQKDKSFAFGKRPSKAINLTCPDEFVAEKRKRESSERCQSA